MAEEICPRFSHRRPRAAAALLLFAAALPTPAAAIVGPSTDAEMLASHVVMVLQRSGSVAGFCSGIVLSPRVVLTAAHCAPAGADLRIHFKDQNGKPVLLPVTVAVRHPGYRADAIRSRKKSIDLAVLKLPEPLSARFEATPIGTAERTAIGTAFRVAGFGVARENEGATSGILRVATLQARAPLSSLLLWAEDPTHRGAGACTGDSGGPVFEAQGGQVDAITLWSAGEGAAECGTLTQALWLAPQRPWIAGIIEGWGLTPP